MDHKNAVKEESKSTHINKQRKNVKLFGFWKDRIIWYKQCFVALVKPPPPASALRVWQKQLLQRSLVISVSPNEKGIFSSFFFFWISSNIWCDRLTTSYFLKHFIRWSLQYPIFLIFLVPCWVTCLTPVCWVLLSIEILNVAFPLSSYPGWWLQLLSGC